MIDAILERRYGKLSNLNIAVHSSRSMINQALIAKFKPNDLKIASYLILCGCCKEFVHATGLEIDRFSIDEYDTISCYYNRLVNESLEYPLLNFSSVEVKLILEEIGDSIRSYALKSHLLV